MVNIHPTAIVSKKAKLGENLKVGPFAVIHEDVEIGNDCIIDPHVVIYDGARIGNRVHIFQGASVANVPQDLKFENEKTFFFIDDDTQIRECVTLHRGTKSTGQSSVGKNCLLMAYVHIAHDCKVGNNVIIANTVQIAGHSVIGDYVTIGGISGIHQFSKIGAYAMVGANSKVTSDVPPFTIVGGNPARFEGLNKIGLKRRGFTDDQINQMKEAYRILYLSGNLFSEAKTIIKNELGEHEVVKQILDFIEQANRGIVRK